MTGNSSIPRLFNTRKEATRKGRASVLRKIFLNHLLLRESARLDRDGQVKFGKLLQKNEDEPRTRAKNDPSSCPVWPHHQILPKRNHGLVGSRRRRSRRRAHGRTCAALRWSPVSAPAHLPVPARRSWRSGRVPDYPYRAVETPSAPRKSHVRASNAQMEGKACLVPGPDHHRQSLAQSTELEAPSIITQS